jgi:hypothetical protein
MRTFNRERVAQWNAEDGYPAMLSCGAFLRVYQLRSSDQLCGTLR